MLTKLRNRLKNQEGSYLLECLCICTCAFCICIISMASLGAKVAAEFGDLGSAVGALNQSYTKTGLAVGHPNDPTHPTDVATWAGSSFVDTADFCDQSGNCGIRACIAPTPEG